MPIDFASLKEEPRLLLEVDLRPIQGTRFQPTGFPDLGAATYELPDGTQMVLVESPQSMANRLEDVCWDYRSNDLIKELKDLPYVKIIDAAGAFMSCSILEAHRLNSPYILESNDKTFLNKLKIELGVKEKAKVDFGLLAKVLCKYDPNCLLHGLFLAKKDISGGRFKLPRAMSAFIEARDAKVVPSGGIKRDDIDPSGTSKEGFGHVPFSREEYAGNITAYFSLDLAQIRGYVLGENVENMLIALSIYKILRFLDSGLRLRTACDLELTNGVKVIRPKEFVPPKLADLQKELPSLVVSCKELFAKPAITEVKYIEAKPKTAKE